MIRFVVKLREWTPGRLPEILSECGLERSPGTGESRIDKVIPQLRVAGVLASDDHAESLLDSLRAHPEIEYAHLDARAAGGRRPSATAYHRTSNDPGIDALWALKRSLVFAAHRITRGARVKVASMDSGLQYVMPYYGDNGGLHHDLPIPALSWNTAGEYADYADPGFDFGLGMTWTHGQGVYSVIHARGDNAIGIIGVAPDSTPCVLVDHDEMPGEDAFPATALDLAEGYVLAGDWGCASFAHAWMLEGGLFLGLNPGGDTVLGDAVQYAKATGCIIAASAGNWNNNFDIAEHYPAELPDVLAVSGCQHNDAISWYPASLPPATPSPGTPGTLGYAAFGQSIDIVAPSNLNGVCNVRYHPNGIPSLFTDEVEAWDGTSFGGPLTAGVLGLVSDVNPALSVEEKRLILRTTASRSFDPNFAWFFPNAGIVDAYNACLKTLATLSAEDLAARFPSRAGQTVFPYFAAWKARPAGGYVLGKFNERSTSTTPPDGPWSVQRIEGGAMVTRLDGAVAIDLDGWWNTGTTGYASAARVDEIEVKLGTEVIYSGPPARLDAVATYSAGTAQPLSIRARAGVTWSEPETYSDVLVSTLEFDLPAGPHTLRIEAGGAPVYATLVPGADLPTFSARGSLSTPALSASVPLPTFQARGGMDALDVTATLHLPTFAGKGGFTAPEFLSPETGHRLRIVAGGEPVIVDLVPGADMPTLGAASSFQAPTLSAAPPLPTMAGAGAMAIPGLGLGLPSFVGAGAFVQPAFSALVTLPTMRGKGRFTPPFLTDDTVATPAVENRWRIERGWQRKRSWAP